MIRRKDQAFNQDQPAEGGRELELVQSSGTRDGQDAGDKEKPDDSVQKLDSDRYAGRL